MPLEENIKKLSLPRTKEWIMYHKYQLFKLKNDRIFHSGRVEKLTLHSKSLIIKHAQKLGLTSRKEFNKTTVSPGEAENQSSIPETN